MINSSDTIGDCTRDLPACSAVPQPTAPPRAPYVEGYCFKISIKLLIVRYRQTETHLQAPDEQLVYFKSSKQQSEDSIYVL